MQGHLKKVSNDVEDVLGKSTRHSAVIDKVQSQLEQRRDIQINQQASVTSMESRVREVIIYKILHIYFR